MSYIEKAPFRSDITPEIFRANTLALGDHVVRGRDEFKSYGLDSSNRRVEGLVEARRLYEELTESYSIKHAGFHPLVGKLRDGSMGEFIVSKRVAGKGYAEVDPYVPDEERPAAKVLLERLTHYVTDKEAQQSPYLSDVFRLDQYKYDASENEMVLVDIDPLIRVEEAAYLAYRDMAPYAFQVLDEAELTEWQAHMASMIPISKQQYFADQNF